MPKLYDRSKLPTAPVVVAPPPASAPPLATQAEHAVTGPRKLIRPRLAALLGGIRRRSTGGTEDPLTHALNEQHAPESTHAEAFYFQKQVQQSTPMTIVLEDGEELHGTIEWHDRAVVKMRLANRDRALIYKSGIKYLFKSSELRPSGSVMK